MDAFAMLGQTILIMNSELSKALNGKSVHRHSVKDSAP